MPSTNKKQTLLAYFKSSFKEDFYYIINKIKMDKEDRLVLIINKIKDINKQLEDKTLTDENHKILLNRKTILKKEQSEIEI